MRRSSQSTGVLLLVVGAVALAVFFWRLQAPGSGERYAASTDQSHPSQPTQGEPTGSADLDRSDIQADELESEEPQPELAPDLKWLREETTNDVLVAYSLMFRHLGLTPVEQNALTDFLVEVWMSETIMANYRPEPIGEEYRRAGIAAIIGDEKLEQLLDLERSRAEYREAERVARFLQTNDVPLTNAQQDDLLNILIRVRGSEQAAANSNVQKGTVEAIESQIATMDEYERLVLELAPSVLTSRQMELLFARYQNLSYRRAQMLELQKKTRANEDEEDDFPLGYPPRN